LASTLTRSERNSWAKLRRRGGASRRQCHTQMR
jgi:hypothetical protein